MRWSGGYFLDALGVIDALGEIEYAVVVAAGNTDEEKTDGIDEVAGRLVEFNDPDNHDDGNNGMAENFNAFFFRNRQFQSTSLYGAAFDLSLRATAACS